MPWTAAAIVGGALISADAASSAANTQAGAGQAGIAGQQQMLASQQAVQQPYVSAGQQALQQLAAGTQPGGQFTQQFDMGQALPQYQAPTQGLQTFQPAGGALPEFKPFQYQGSDAQNFATSTAMDAMRNQMQAGGQALSSNAIVGAGKLAGDIGSQYEQQAYNQWLASQNQQFGQAVAGRQLTAAEQAQQFTQGMAGRQLSAAEQAQQYGQALGSQQQAQSVWAMNQQAQLQPLQYLTGIGQAAASGQAANIGSAGANISNLQTGIGNVQAAGQVGSANALAGGINSASQMYMLQNLLGSGGSGSGGSGVGSNTYSDAAAGMMASGGASDPRLKKNIKLVGKTVHDLNLYTFNYIWDDSKTYRGVMSNEVEIIMPGAVTKDSGYDMVNYEMLGIQMEEV